MKSDRIYLALFSLIIFTTISWISSCTHETDISNIPEICYKEIQTIIFSNCSMENSGCHDGTGEADPLLSYEDIRDIVVPFSADESQLYEAITAVRGEKQMPPGKPLTQELRSILRFWIEQGAVDSTQNSPLCQSSKGSAGTGNDNSLNIK